MLTRREWMAATAAAALAAAAGPRAAQKSIETVRGAIGADRLGLTLMHEHVLVDFIEQRRAMQQRGPRSA